MRVLLRLQLCSGDYADVRNFHHDVVHYQATWSTAIAGGSIVIDNTVELQLVDDGWVHCTCKATARNRALESVDTCRTGFVVLHPAALAGQRLQVGTETKIISTIFPRLVAPNQLFTDVNSLSYDVVEQRENEVAEDQTKERKETTEHKKKGKKARKQALFTFSSDELQPALFETEDQRQWLDGSFKTYYRPLREAPLPYSIEGGATVSQSVDIHFTTTNMPPQNSSAELEKPELPAVATDERSGGSAVCSGRGSSGERAGTVEVTIGRSTSMKMPAVGANIRPWIEQQSQHHATNNVNNVPALGSVLWCRYDHVEDGAGAAAHTDGKNVPAVLASLAKAATQEAHDKLILEVVLPCDSFDGDALQKECKDVAAAFDAAGVNPTHIFVLPRLHISNSATQDYHLPADAAGPPSYIEAEPSTRFDYVPLDAMLAAARASFPPGIQIGK